MQKDATYPKDFKKTAMTIFKRLFRVFAIIYCSHFDNIEQLGAAAHLNTSFKVQYRLYARSAVEYDHPVSVPHGKDTNGLL